MCRLLCLAFLVLLLTSTVSASEPASKIGADVEQALKSQQRVRVMLMIATDATPKSDAMRKRDIARDTDTILQALPRTHYTLLHRYVRVPALALEIDADALERLTAMSLVKRIDLDAGGTGAMLQAAPLARVTDTLNAGLTGIGAKIAVIDSGIDTDHQDFAGRITAQQCFCAGSAGAVGCCPNSLDTMSGAGSAEDNHGHGTNVTGIATGGGTVAARGGAPAASIVSVKVLDANNSFCCASDVVAALDWVRQNHADTDVVNASLGTGMLFPSVCDTTVSFTQAMSVAVNNLVQNGTMVFASSGNQGSPTSVSAPACLQNVVAVAAVWDANSGPQNVLGCMETTAADKATCFSNSGALIDLYAPGAPVTSSGFSGGTSTFFGTSQATPLTAGCATALRAEFPSATLAQIEAALEGSPTSIVDAKNGLTFPRLDCAAAAVLLDLKVFANGFEGT